MRQSAEALRFAAALAWVAGLGLNQAVAGTIVPWGAIPVGTPSTLSDVVAIAAGESQAIIPYFPFADQGHCLALKTDGTVLAWGANSFGQANVPSGLANVVAIAAGGYHSVALTSEGAVVAWGNGTSGQTAVPLGLSNVVAIAAGWAHTLALDETGSVFAWGGDGQGQIDIPPGLSNVVAIAAGGFHSLALKGDGTVIAWGAGQSNPTGLLISPNQQWEAGQSLVPAGLTNVVAIAAGGDHSLALKSDGTVIVWGDETTAPPGLSNVVAISAGEFHSLALTAQGMVVAWGDNGNGQTSMPLNLSNVTAIAGGDFYSLALTSDGSPSIATQPINQVLYSGGTALFSAGAVGLPVLAYQWQFNGTNINGATDATFIVTNAQAVNDGVYAVVVTNSLGAAVSSNAFLKTIDSGPTILNQPVAPPVLRRSTFTLAVAATGSLPLFYQWQFNGTNIAGATHPMLQFASVNPTNGGRYDVVVSNRFGTTISSNVNLIVVGSQVVVWGAVPHVPIDLTNAVAIAGGAFHCVALRSDATVLAWGLNDFGQTNTPSDLTNVVAIAAGQSHSLALKRDGTVVAWGLNANGQTNVPPDLTNVVAIAAGQLHSLALKSDATVVSWGIQNPVPTGLSNVAAIAGGWGFSLALKTDGTVTAWGDNSYGQTNVPPGLTNVVAAAAGAGHGLALRADGTVAAWNKHDLSLLYTDPTVLPDGLTNVVTIAGGGDHSLALRGDGTVVAWGAGTNTDAGIAPFLGQSVVPAGLTNVIAVGAGYFSSLALQNDGSAFIARQPVNKLAYIGTTTLFSVGAVGLPPLSYQWMFNGARICGATNACLTLANVTSANQGEYRVRVRNRFAAVLSSNVSLTVLRPTPYLDLRGGPPFANGTFIVRIGGLSAHGPVVISASTNMLDWQAILTNPPTMGSLQFLDPAAPTLPRRFYRAYEQ